MNVRSTFASRTQRAFVGRVAVALLAISTFVACGTAGLGGNAVFVIAEGWDEDTTIPIALGSVFSATAREADAFGSALIVDSENAAIVKHTASDSDTFEAVGVGTVALIAKDQSGSEVDRITVEVAAPNRAVAAHWTDASIDAKSELASTIAAVGGGNVQLKVRVSDIAGRDLRHRKLVSLVVDSGTPLTVDPGTETSFNVGAAGVGKLSLKVKVANGAPIIKPITVNIVDISDISKLDVAAGPVVTVGGDTKPGTSTSGSSSQMYLVFARCQDPGGARVYGCKPKWTKVSGDSGLTLPASSASEFNWIPLEPGQQAAIKATLSGMNATKIVKHD